MCGPVSRGFYELPFDRAAVGHPNTKAGTVTGIGVSIVRIRLLRGLAYVS